MNFRTNANFAEDSDAYSRALRTRAYFKSDFLIFLY